MSFLPYGRQEVTQEDIDEVITCLKSPYLTTGPKVVDFESGLINTTGSKNSIVCSSGTSALHLAYLAAGIGKGDEVIVPAISFVATANAVLYCGAKPVFVDVRTDNLTIDVEKVTNYINEKTVAIVAVDYAGFVCDYDMLYRLCEQKGLKLITDGSHSLGSRFMGKPLTSYSSLVTTSFHPVKHITTGEGGAVFTNSTEDAINLRRLRSHGIDRDHNQRNSYEYDMVTLGYNYRLSDISCALGLSQLRRLNTYIKKRIELASAYIQELANRNLIQHYTPLSGPRRPDDRNVYHLFVVKVNRLDRDKLYQYMKDNGVGCNVHYRPIYQLKYYRETGFQASCPVAEDAYNRMITLPLHQCMALSDVVRVVELLEKFKNSN